MNVAVAPAVEFQRALEAYSAWSSKAAGPLIEDRGRKMRFELYRRFRALAKSPSALRAEIAARGFAIRRRVDAEAQLAAQSAGGTAPPVDIETEIKARIKSLRFLSVSFLFRAWRSTAGGQDSRFTARSRASARIGDAILRTRVGHEAPFVSITSLLEGAVVQNDRRHIVDQALSAQAADMAVYVARKHREKMQELFKATYAVALRA